MHRRDNRLIRIDSSRKRADSPRLRAPAASQRPRPRRPTRISSPRSPRSNAATGERLDALAPRLAGHVLERVRQYWQLKLASRRTSGATRSARISRAMARWPACRSAARRLAEGAGQARRLDRVRARLSAARRRRRRAHLLRDPVSPAARRRRGARRREAAVVHRAIDARRLRAAVRGADRARRRFRSRDRRARFRLATAAGNMRLAQAIAAELPGRGANHREGVRRRSSAIRSARWPRDNSRGRRRRARARAVCARARRAQGRRPACAKRRG